MHKATKTLLERARGKVQGGIEGARERMGKIRGFTRVLFVDERGVHFTGVYMMPAKDADYLMVRRDGAKWVQAVHVLDIVCVL